MLKLKNKLVSLYTSDQKLTAWTVFYFWKSQKSPF